MKFEEVLPALREGKVVRRTAWDGPAISYVRGIGFAVKLNYDNHWFNTPDVRNELSATSILAEDWEVADE